MQLTQTPSTPFDASTYAHNHETMLAVLHGTDGPIVPDKREPDLTLRLERILVNRSTNLHVPYEGELGIEAVLTRLSETWNVFEKKFFENHLMGLHGRLALASGELVPLVISLAAGGQVVCTAGPSTSVESLLQVVEAFDRQIHIETKAMGCAYELVAEGYNPYISSPLDVSLVPRARWTLLTAHLSQTGRYARDVMRCGCSTSVGIVHTGTASVMEAYRLATALVPLLNFLCDNVRSFRGAGARRTQRMIRSVMWDEVDPTRCGIVPGTFDNDFSFEAYLLWLEGIQPILFENQDGSVASTGKSTLKEVMGTRTFTRDEAAHFLHNVYPPAKLLEHVLQISAADALRPRQAAAYVAFLKGLFRNELSVNMALSTFEVTSVQDVQDASFALRKYGWNATIYGKPVVKLADDLTRISRAMLTNPAEHTIMRGLTELWDVHMVPRDAFVHQEIKEARGW